MLYPSFLRSLLIQVTFKKCLIRFFPLSMLRDICSFYYCSVSTDSILLDPGIELAIHLSSTINNWKTYCGQMTPPPIAKTDSCLNVRCYEFWKSRNFNWLQQKVEMNFMAKHEIDNYNRQFEILIKIDLLNIKELQICWNVSILAQI